MNVSMLILSTVFCQKLDFPFLQKCLSKMSRLDAAGVVGNVGDAKRKVCRIKVRRGGCISDKYVFSSFEMRAFLRSIEDKIGKVSLGAGWVDRSIFG